MLDEFFQWIGARSSTIHTIHTISYDLLRSRTISYDLVRSAYDLTYRYVPIPGPFRLHISLYDDAAGPCRIRTAHVNAKRGVSTGENRGSIAGASARVRAVPGRRGVSPRSVGGRAGTGHAGHLNMGRGRGGMAGHLNTGRGRVGTGGPCRDGRRARRDGRAIPAWRGPVAGWAGPASAWDRLPVVPVAGVWGPPPWRRGLWWSQSDWSAEGALV